MEICLNEIQRSPFEDLSPSFTYIETIANGAFGTVVLAENTKTKQQVAVKILHKSIFKLDTVKIKEEIIILKQLNHPNIVKFYDYIETTNNIFIIMEYISKTTLKTFITQYKGHISEEMASTIMKHLLNAIQYIHSKNICHRDIKPENIMFGDINDLSSLKLIDFGLSAQHYEYFMKPEFCGTFIYMSPEQIENKTYTQCIDIWSAGVILYLLLNKGIHPFYVEGDTKKKYISKIKACEFKQIKSSASQMAMKMLKVMLEPNPQIRISAQTALKHPWITRRMFDDIPRNVIESITQSSIQHKVQNIFILALFIKYVNTGNSSSTLLSEEYERKLQLINKEGNEYFKNQRINMFNVITTTMKDNGCGDVGGGELTDNNEQDTTQVNSITSTSLVSSRMKQKNNLSTSKSKQKMYVFNTPRKATTKKEMYKTNVHSLIKRSYSTFEVKCTRNVKTIKINSNNNNKAKAQLAPCIMMSSPLHKNMYNDEHTVYKFQQSLRNNFSPIKTKTVFFPVKQSASSKKHTLNNNNNNTCSKKEIQSPFSAKKFVKKMSIFQLTSKKDNLYPLILPNIKIKAVRHLSNKKISLRHIN